MVAVPAGKVGGGFLWLHARSLTRYCWTVPNLGRRHVQDGKTREVRLVDVPGHARIAHRIFSEHVERARGIIFMVDSVDFMSHRVPTLCPL